LHIPAAMKKPEDRHVLFEDDGVLRIAAEDVDPRGWQLLCSDGGVFGTVTGLVADQENLRISHLVCEVYSPTPHQVLLPAHFARFDQQTHSVIYDALARAEVDLLPDFSGLPIDPADENEVLALLTNDEVAPQPGTSPVPLVDRRRGDRRRS